MFARSDDQRMLEDTAARFLGTHYPVERIRELARAEQVFEPERWQEAATLGWTTLLVPESAGGGAISGNGLVDLTIVAAQFGWHAAPGPLLPTNAVAAALGRWGSPAQQSGPLAEIVAGDAVATWGHRGACTAVAEDDGIELRGTIASVESAADARYLLVPADDATGGSHYLVPLASKGVARSPRRGIDLTRRFWDVTLDGVRLGPDARVGEPGAAHAQQEALRDVVAALALGEMAGSFHRAFALTLDWVGDRYSFGRPLSSYQAIKHRVADLRTQLEAAEAVAARAAWLVGSDEPAGREWVSAGMAHVGRHVPEAIQDCVQLHGGIGVTYEHDLHLFLRRAALDANLYGSPREFAERLGRIVVDRERLVAAEVVG